MQRDSGAAKRSGRDRADWRTWLSEPWRVGATLVGVLLTGLLLGYVVAAVAVFPAQELGTDLRRVPDLVGATATYAREQVERSGLSYVVRDSLPHPAAEAGTVIAQDPLPGQMAAPNAQVEVMVSLGPRQRPVPNVQGLSQRQAEIALQRAGFATEVTWVDAELNVGQVVETRPEAGARLRLPGSVRLLVSAGPPAVDVPDLVTRSLPEARAALERIGLRLGEVSQDSASLAAPGTIIDQRPAAGSVVERASRVNVTVAIVPPPVSEGDTLDIEGIEDTLPADHPGSGSDRDDGESD